MMQSRTNFRGNVPSLKNIITTGFLASFLLFGLPSKADAVKIQKPKLELLVKGGFGVHSDIINYNSSSSFYNEDKDGIARTDWMHPRVPSYEMNIITEAMKKSNKRSSISKNISKTLKDLSDEAKLVFLSSFSEMLADKFYNRNFYRCSHISGDVEKSAESMGMNSFIVSGWYKKMAHSYNLIKLKDKTAVINYSNLFVSKSKNIEKVLAAFQKQMGVVCFHHLLYKKGELALRYLTKEGKNLSEFLGYDLSDKPLKNSLCSKTKKESDLRAKFDFNDSYFSAELNSYGAFTKLGVFYDKMIMFQCGYKNKFAIPGIIKINPSAGFVYGNFINDSRKEKNIFGFSGDLLIASDLKYFNIASRFLGTDLSNAGNSIFYDLSAEIGASCRIPINKISITPYFSARFNFLLRNLFGSSLEPGFDNFSAGAVADLPAGKNSKLSIDASYSATSYENGFRLNTIYSSKFANLNAGGYFSKSLHELNPDKYGFNAGISVRPAKNICLGFNAKNDITNYDGEIDNNLSFSFESEFKL